MDDIALRIFTIYIPLLFSLCVHEWAHARMALIKGDDLAYHMGRLSLNPMVHADLIGTVLLPLISIVTNAPVFGWAKPVPVSPRALKNPKKDMFWIALAGPLSNFCLAFIGAMGLMVLHIIRHHWQLSDQLSLLTTMTITFIHLNVLLGFFNLIPLYPLDGGQVLARFIPWEWSHFLEQNQQYTFIVLVILMVTGGLRYLIYPAYHISVQLIQLTQQLPDMLI